MDGLDLAAVDIESIAGVPFGCPEGIDEEVRSEHDHIHTYGGSIVKTSGNK